LQNSNFGFLSEDRVDLLKEVRLVALDRYGNKEFVEI
jgi:hypothetical protein